ncbi:hypothetical protein FLL45_21910 [Aliikangiella marina]|uniref:BioF2-like acetyltransferase domain-containing protein n=1 Tax=Aliikangiella marina TaxID=1712262 RepID=A0A545T1D3_9GAMM|nr:GNAT family N-acetyltransferase [Aliikangiella marina]TQV70985.1 hypothetical protein FLL45_21910 [Aliikangiella marina]
MQVKILNSDQIDQVDRQQWDRLAQKSATTNPFYESWNLIPALKYFTKNSDVKVVAAYKAEELIALFPIELGNRKFGIPYIDVWKHHHCFLTDPLCSQPDELAKIVQFTIRNLKMLAFRIRDHSFCSFGRDINQNSVIVEYSRGAILNLNGVAKHLINLPRKIRSENNRITKRFSEATKAEYVTSDTHPKVDWLKVFCELEDSGWKAKAKTSILSDDDTLNYYQAMHENAAKLGKIQYQGYRNQSTWFAVAFRVISNNQAFDLKTCYNESYKQVYPGVNLELANLKALEQYGYQSLDSCTMSENYLINRIWPDQKPLFTSFYFHGGILSTVFKLIYRLKKR